MKKNKIILIGGIRKGKKAVCGETMKNQFFIKRFSELFDKVIAVDTYNWRKRPWCIIEIFFTLLFNPKAKVIISASASCRHLIHFLNKIPLNKNVYFWVIGGKFPLFVKEGLYRIDALNKLKKILVEGEKMLEDLNKLGVNNVICVPNFKPIIFSPQIEPKKDDIYKFVFLSRIHPDKGIKEIIEAYEILYRNGYKDRFTIDFYGLLPNDFKEDFFTMISNKENISYNGFINLRDENGYKQLSTYDVMLFPTYWGGEGFPGVVIDAYIAGLPIIATDWNLNKYVIEDNKTGIIIPVHNSDALAESMKKFIDKSIDLNLMKQNCVENAKKYDYKNVLSERLMKELELK
ncbi:MAG: glycosyltransferase [Bacteroidales bacterium]|jgi:glycosyltransferase involved in cell wall biosynthesis